MQQASSGCSSTGAYFLTTSALTPVHKKNPWHIVPSRLRMELLTLINLPFTVLVMALLFKLQQLTIFVLTHLPKHFACLHPWQESTRFGAPPA